VEIGAHVASSGGLLSALGRGEVLGCEVIQLFTQSPRMWRPPSHSPEILAAYRAAQVSHETISATFCHATYLINLATAQGELAERSTRCLVDNLAAATAMGASGLVLHVGSHRGAGLHSVSHQVTRALLEALDEVEASLGETPCPLLLENAAGAGGTVGRSLSELALLLDAAADPRLGICLDTQHLFASGIAYDSRAAADHLVAELDQVIGVGRLGCIHLNDSKVPLGANRDRHENLGEGMIGTQALAWLLGHPRLQHVPAILEVPGEGSGPRDKDLVTAREILALGYALRSKEEK